MNRLALAALPRPPRQPTRLQVHVARVGDAVDLIERLPGRERAVALDLASRLIARAMVDHRCVLEEHGLWPAAA